MTSMLNRKLLFLVGLVLIIALGCWLYFSGALSSAPKNLYRIGKGEITQRVTIAGTIVPFRKTVINAPYNGYIKKLFVKVGDQVKIGEPLVTIAQSLQSIETVFPLRSPVNGMVVQVEKSEGEFSRENDSKDFILRIDDLSQLHVLANVPEIERVKLKIGQEALIKAAAILDRKYNGIVRELFLAARSKEEYSKAIEFPVRIEVLDRDDRLRPGMSVLVDIIAQKKSDVLVLEHRFVLQVKDKHYVFDRTNTKHEIEIGLQDEERCEISKGLKEGDEVLPVDFSMIE